MCSYLTVNYNAAFNASQKHTVRRFDSNNSNLAPNYYDSIYVTVGQRIFYKSEFDIQRTVHRDIFL